MWYAERPSNHPQRKTRPRPFADVVHDQDDHDLIEAYRDFKRFGPHFTTHVETIRAEIERRGLEVPQ